MITIKVEGLDDLFSALDGMKRQVPYAMANGLNAVARLVKDAELKEMKAVFKDPTPFTLNSLKMTPAKAPNGPMKASVWFKDPPNLGQKDHYLLPQIEGGRRQMKRFETAMGKKYVIPSKYSQRDQYGNLGRGMITKLMSAEGSFTEAGFKMNTTRKSPTGLVVIKKKRGSLLPGIYQRVSTASQIGKAMSKATASKNHSAGLRKALKSQYPRGLMPVVIFTDKQPTYRKRFDFYGVGQRVIDHHLRSEMKKAIDIEFDRELAYRARKQLW